MMNTLFADIMYKLLVMLMSLSMLFGGIADPRVDDSITSKDPDNVKLTVVFWGDSQVSDYMLSRQKYMRASCIDVNNSSEQIDALLIDGDIAENGKASEYRLVLDDIGLINTVDNFIFATGNHDVRLKIFSNTVSLFSDFCHAANNKLELDKLYYSYEVNGYKFIVLGTVSSTFEEAEIDKEELEWFEAELDENEGTGKPVFVLLHQPLKFTHGLPDSWNSPVQSAGSVGKQSDQLKNIMNKYSNVFLLTGHLHSGFGVNSFEDVENIHSVNVPSIGIVSKDGGYEAAGTGYMIEVYENSVVFRARNFAEGYYMPEYDFEYPLVKQINLK